MINNIIYGINTIKETLIYTKRIKEVYLFSKNKEIELLCFQKRIKIIFKNKEFFTNLAKSSQRIAAKVSEFPYSRIELIENLGENTSILILDRIQDPQNFGAIIRTAVAAKFDAIIISKTNQVEITPVVEKVAVGAVNRIPIIKVSNISNSIKKLQDNNFWVVGTGLENSQDYRKIDYLGKIALVVGSENSGIRRLVLENCDYIAKLPISDSVESLNVAVATGIMCYHIHSIKNPPK